VRHIREQTLAAEAEPLRQELLRAAPPLENALTASAPLAPITAAAGVTAGGVTAAGGVATLTIPLQLNLSVSLGTATQPADVARGEEELLGLFGQRPAPAAKPAVPTATDFRLDALTRTAFDWQTAQSLALASQLAYSPAAEVERQARAWGFADCRFVEAGAAQGFLASTASVVLVTFRGTESTADWLSNLQVQLKTVPGLGKVHAGFWGQFTALQPQLETLLQARRNVPIVVSGHSLGGAIAVLAAATWAASRPVRALYTYGQPAVAQAGAATRIGTTLAGRHHRLVNDADIVPRVPPGYTHSGHLLHFDDRGRVKDVKEPTVAREAALATTATAASEGAMLNPDDFVALQQRLRAQGAAAAQESVTDLISDHMIDQYLLQIRKQLRCQTPTIG
ncbi:MAG: lipase family protein, partial [Cyanobium sp.]